MVSVILNRISSAGGSSSSIDSDSDSDSHSHRIVCLWSGNRGERCSIFRLSSSAI